MLVADGLALDYSKPSGAIGFEDHPRYSETPLVTDRRSDDLNAQLEEWERDQAAKRELEAASAPAIGAASGDRDLDAWEDDLGR